MKNRIILCSVFALLFAPVVSQARWGLDLSAANWEMDAEDHTTNVNTLTRAWAASGYALSSKVDPVTYGLEAKVFMEGNAPFRLGISVGVGLMPEVVSNFHARQGLSYNDLYLENRTNYIPVELYAKYASKGGKFSIFAGGGANYLMASTEYKVESTGNYWEKGTFEQSKTIPHARAGCEFFLAKWLALNVGVKYVFSGVLDNLTGKMSASSGGGPGEYRMIMFRNPTYGEYMDARLTSAGLAAGERPFQYDYSGLRLNAGLRVYFK